MSQYPRDEFDKIPESASRQGVHRERLVPPRSTGLGLKILVGVLALAVGLAAFFVLPRLGFGSGAEPATDQPTSSTAAPGAPSPSASDDAGPSEPAPSEAAPDQATDEDPADGDATPTGDPDGIDRSQPVNVLNATGIEGQTRTAVDRVSVDGWTVGEVADWGGVVLQTSVIFYNDASQLAAAEDLSEVLGIPTLVETTEVSPNITVVIGPGFQ